MAKFRKKPVVIEAVQHFDNMGQQTMEWPRWLISAITDGVIYAKGQATFIQTLEGNMRVTDGDWIIQGVQGEIYPCKPDIFAASYEAA